MAVPAFELVAPFGTSVHVGGRDREGLERAIDGLRGRDDLVWRADSPSLEDVFIDLINRSKDKVR